MCNVGGFALLCSGLRGRQESDGAVLEVEEKGGKRVQRRKRIDGSHVGERKN